MARTIEEQARLAEQMAANASKIARSVAPVLKAMEPMLRFVSSMERSGLFSVLRTLEQSPAVKSAALFEETLGAQAATLQNSPFVTARRSLENSPAMKATLLAASPIVASAETARRWNAMLQPAPSFLRFTTRLEEAARAADFLRFRWLETEGSSQQSRCEGIESAIERRDVETVKSFTVIDLRLPPNYWAAVTEVLFVGAWREESEPIEFIRLETMRLFERLEYADRSIFSRRFVTLTPLTIESHSPPNFEFVREDLEATLRELELPGELAVLLLLKSAGIPRARMGQITGWRQRRAEALWKLAWRHEAEIFARLRSRMMH